MGVKFIYYRTVLKLVALWRTLKGEYLMFMGELNLYNKKINRIKLSLIFQIG